MRLIPLILALGTLTGCVGPMPAHDPQMAWVDLQALNGTLVMSDKLDGKTTPDGRYFQLEPGAHQLQVRYDYEYSSGGLMSMFGDEYTELTCFIRVNYDQFAAGQRYRLTVRTMANDVEARLYDAQRKLLAKEGDIHCI